MSRYSDDTYAWDRNYDYPLSRDAEIESIEADAEWAEEQLQDDPWYWNSRQQWDYNPNGDPMDPANNPANNPDDTEYRERVVMALQDAIADYLQFSTPRQLFKLIAEEL